MIRVDRSSVPPPATLESELAGHEQSRASAFFALDERGRGQRRFEFNAELFGSSDVKAALMQLFSGKCAYCETPIGERGIGDVEHHRPKAWALGLDGAPAPDHYWWLAYDWNNLYLVCHRCNRMKASRFPVVGERARIGATGDALLAEQALLLDPCVDEPTDHLVFTEYGEVVSSTERGRATIEILGLNRSDLIAARASVFNELRSQFEQIERLLAADSPQHALLNTTLQQLETQLGRSQPYACMRRQFVFRWLRDHGVEQFEEGRALIDQLLPTTRLVTEEEQQGTILDYAAHQVIKQSYSVEAEDTTARSAYFEGAKRIERIEIRNFKAIEALDLQFPPPQQQGAESWLMLLGENGTGKSGVLQAVALALMGERHANELGLDASRFVRRNAPETEGTVRVFLTGLTTPIELRFRRDSPQFTVMPPDPKVLLLGYGATRLLPRPGLAGDERRYIRIQNLFDPTAPLNDAETWLSNGQGMDDQKFDQIALALKDLLLLGQDDFLDRENGTVCANIFGSAVSLRELSDGFQSVVALCCDIMISMSERWPSMQDAEGIVLIDEIEVHLHPTWKIQIVERLRRVFPRVGFLVTTHDPLCLRGLSEGEIAILERNDEGRIVARTNIPPIDHLRADQILSLLFGLSTTRGSATVGMIARYSDLLGKGERTAEEQIEFEDLRARLSGSIASGETPAQREVEQAIRTTLAQMQPQPQMTTMTRSGENIFSALTPDLEAELKRQLTELLS
jgi:uncharacterized protein (TIGR02646 family)